MVGCVVVYQNKIVAEGAHEFYGGLHAEPNAIRLIPAEIPIEQCTLYVNLEPCNHFGKTPPCTDLIISKNFRKVVIGQLDPNPLVNGKGVERLRANNIEVIDGIALSACLKLNRRFNINHLKKRPYVILKWAESQDGFMDIHRENNEKGSFQLSSDTTRKLVHRWRSEEMGILIGKNTAQIDNPELTVREVHGENPVRIILDTSGIIIQEDLNLWNKEAPTVLITENENIITNRAEILVVKNIKDWSSNLEQILQMGISSILVEGGRKILVDLLKSGQFDEIRRIRTSALLKKGLPAPSIQGLVRSEVLQSENDLIEFYFR
jgi:diaminohydroxyphosphoribosylaminopyrimidine deaminase/5-amino-6-(5-phosphoribosylamino)uracil reductase